MVGKIENACHDERRTTLNLVYPNICEGIETVMKNDACMDTYTPEKITKWTNKKGTEFSELILRYARENIVKVNIYIKDPFAVKFLIEANASRLINKQFVFCFSVSYCYLFITLDILNLISSPTKAEY